MSVRVVKVGGRPLGDPAWLARFAGAAARAPRGLVVVHGGGPEVDVLSGRLGIPVERVGGRRITPPEAMEVTAMVLSGRINKRVVSALLGAGADALGVSGEDGALIEAELAEGGALGRVGTVMRVRAGLLRHLVAFGAIPVVSPVSRGLDGGSLNVNADDAAMAVAASLDAAELIFLTDVPAVHDGVRDRECLEAAEAADLLARGIARDGMAVKVSAALRALEAGVASVRIGPLETLDDPEAGTRLLGKVEVAL